MARARTVTAVLAASATAAGAQDWIVGTDAETGRHAAVACAGAEAADAGAARTCLSLGCGPGAPPDWRFTVAGPTGPGPLALTVAVDGGAAGVLDFPEPDGEATGGRARAFDPEEHGTLAARLRAGARARLSWEGDGGAAALDLGLRGSSRAIAAVLGACALPESPPVADPEGETRAQIAGDCGAAGGTVSGDEGLARGVDLDGDGREDLLLDWGAATCSEPAVSWCGPLGCYATLWLADGTGYRRLFGGVAEGVTARAGGGFEVALHGSYCGRAAEAPCTHLYRIERKQAVRED